MKVKFIEGIATVGEQVRGRGVLTIEDKVEKFLNENPNIELLFVKQSSASEGNENYFEALVTVSIWYKEN